MNSDGTQNHITEHVYSQ